MDEIIVLTFILMDTILIAVCFKKLSKMETEIEALTKRIAILEKEGEQDG